MEEEKRVRSKRPDIAKRMEEFWAGLTKEEREALKERQKAGMRKHWANLSEEQRREIGKNVSKAKKGKAHAKKD
jgi:TRAP-type C4-dicarboxylate transport system substrate-binding protein